MVRKRVGRIHQKCFRGGVEDVPKASGRRERNDITPCPSTPVDEERPFDDLTPSSITSAVPLLARKRKQ
jgi:hypothetical protein